MQVRQKLVNTRKRMEDILQGALQSNDEDEWYETTDALAQPLLSCYWSLWECGSGIVAEGAPSFPIPAPATSNHACLPDRPPQKAKRREVYVCAGRLLDLLRRLSCFGLGLMKMDLRQESSRHTDALAAVTKCVPQLTIT